MRLTQAPRAFLSSGRLVQVGRAICGQSAIWNLRKMANALNPSPRPWPCPSHDICSRKGGRPSWTPAGGREGSLHSLSLEYFLFWKDPEGVVLARKGAITSSIEGVKGQRMSS